MQTIFQHRYAEVIEGEVIMEETWLCKLLKDETQHSMKRCSGIIDTPRAIDRKQISTHG